MWRSIWKKINDIVFTSKAKSTFFGLSFAGIYTGPEYADRTVTESAKTGTGPDRHPPKRIQSITGLDHHYWPKPQKLQSNRTVAGRRKEDPNRAGP